MARIKFLNVDLDVSSKHSIRELTSHLINHGLYNLSEPQDGTACYELDEPTSSANGALSLMLDVLEKLPPDALRAWKTSTRREFNLGFDCGTEPWAFNEPIEPEIVRRISALGGCFRITLYPPPGSAD